MRSIIVTPGGEVTVAVLHDHKNIEAAIGCDAFDGRRVCRLPCGGFLYVYFDDNFIAKRLPANKHVRGLYAGGDLCGTVVLQACNDVGNRINVPSTMTVDNWRSEINRLRAPSPPVQQDGRGPQIPSTATSADEVSDRGEAGQILGRPIADLEAALIAQEGKPHDGGQQMDGVSVIPIGDWGLIRNATRPVAPAYLVTRVPGREGSMEWPSLQLAWTHRNSAPDDDPRVHEQVWQAWLAEHGKRRG